MPRGSLRDEIIQAISDINSISALRELNSTAVKQGVVLKLLSAAGWNPFDLSEVEPEFRSGTSRVDFALKSAPSSRSREPSTPRVFVEVKSLDDNLESDRYERQLLNNCARENVSLGALTNGKNWLLFFRSDDGQQKEFRFCALDLAGDPESAADDIQRYLSKDRVSSGQALRSAERTLLDRSRDEITKRAIVEGWRQVVWGLDEGLIELVATAAEQKTGDKPENRFVRRFLVENRSELLAAAQEDATSTGSRSGGSRRRPASFSFGGETQEVSSWPDLLVGVCSMMQVRHPSEFEKILDIRGRTLSYFSKNEEEVNIPREIGDTGVYASCQGAGDLIEERAKRVVELFGHSRESLGIQDR